MCGAGRGARGAHSPSGKGALGARPAKSNPPREEAGAVGLAAAGSSRGGRGAGLGDPRALDCCSPAAPLRSRPLGRRSPAPVLRRRRGPSGELRCVPRWAAGGSAGGGRTRPECRGLRRHFRRRPRHFRVLRECSAPPVLCEASSRWPAPRCVRLGLGRLPPRRGPAEPAFGSFSPGTRRCFHAGRPSWVRGKLAVCCRGPGGSL